MALHALLDEARRSVCSISCEQARAQLASRTVIDVREPHEVLNGYLPGAINIPRGVLEFAVAKRPQFASHDAPILVYSQHNHRALLAAHALQSLGYTDVLAIEGGFLRWAESDYPVE